MEIKQENLCRLCLKTGELEVIEESTKELFDALLLNIDFSISEQPTICDVCVGNLHKSFDFKAAYMAVEERVISLLKRENTETVDLTALCTSTSDPNCTNDPLYIICRFCVEYVRKESCTPLDELVYWKGSLAVYIPEIDFTATEAPVVCPQCLESIQSYIDFRTTCWYTEEKVKEYLRVSGPKGTDKLKLSDVAIFPFEDNKFITNEAALEGLDEIKQENDVEQQEIHVKNEVDADAHSEPSNPTNNPTNSRTFANLKCPQCMYETKYPQQLVRHLYTHKLYTCKPCAFGTKVKYNLSRHLTTSKCANADAAIITYKCEICSHETDLNSQLDKHMETHKPSEEEMLYKCTICPFKTKRIFNYNRHVIRHLPANEVDMFMCEFCAFQTIEKGVLVRHLLTHKSRSEMTLYKCDQCAYEAKHRYRLKQHQLTHRNGGETRWYYCAYCDFRSKQRYSQTRHLATHERDESSGAFHKCKSCDYQTKRMDRLRRHMLIHRDASELEWFKCEECGFETTQKMYLTRHRKIHARGTDDVVHECGVCGYKTRQKCHLNRHLLVTHKQGQ